jgi:hypothetical protein
VAVESAATGLGETAITAVETFEREMAVIAISDGEVYVELPNVVPDHEGFVMVDLAIAYFVCDDRFGVVMWGREREEAENGQGWRASD